MNNESTNNRSGKEKKPLKKFCNKMKGRFLSMFFQI